MTPSSWMVTLSILIALSGFVPVATRAVVKPGEGGGEDSSSSTPTSLFSFQPKPPPSVLYEFLPTGDIADTECNIEDLERANDSQLHAIFEELQHTQFFRSFLVDLDHKCPLSDWTTTTKSEDHHQTTTTTTTTAEESSTTEEEFECTGGKALDMDEDAEPLCSVDMGGGGDNPFGGADMGAQSLFGASVLQSLSQTGFSSVGQQETFDWHQQTDMIVQDTEGDRTPCDSEEGADLPDSFWMDMCSSIQHGGTAMVVNLALNPERNTGYNGTHIWKAIYEENCISTSDACLEERVLYRLLSGLHTSTTLSIAKNYYPPSKRKGRIDWESNPEFFMEKFQHHPEHIRNMHFSYVVLLRAIKKATSYLYNYDFQSNNALEDKASQVLLNRLLDTAILRSCSSAFSAFDESLMFQQQDNDFSLQRNFKGVFHNISSILDCVQCQQCKLHGKMGMLGYGAALKILFVKPESIVLEPNEVVALINTAARLSESMIHARELTSQYWAKKQKATTAEESSTLNTKINEPSRIPSSGGVPPVETGSTFGVESLDIIDMTVGVIAKLGRLEMISMDRERELVDLALSKHPELMILGKHYANDEDRFLAFSSSIKKVGSTTTTSPSEEEALPDAIVVGSGLAGLAASLNILDRGGSVVILEKEHLLGGNSNKASSGINGCCPHNSTYNDSLEAFRNDTVRSAGSVADLTLIETLVSNSEKAILWLRERASVDLSLLAQLGGHSHKRTHRPSNGMAGAEIIYQMQKAVRSFEKTGKVKILVDTKVTSLLQEGDRVVGVACESTIDGSNQELRADNIILATGGFASDRSTGSYLDQNRPELMAFPATAGAFSTGDGITLATTLGAATRDMEKVQIHPTGWVDPTDPTNPTKILAAELMRGIGGILINDDGERFCNELGTRSYVTNKMLEHNSNFAKTGTWNREDDVPTFNLVISSSAAADGKKHVDLYTHKGLLTKVSGLDALAAKMNLTKSVLRATLTSYQKSKKMGKDEFGKVSFQGVPNDNLSIETFYVGKVTPVLHYCMGGIKIDSEGNVLKEDGTTIKGLHAAGEVTGGVHGNNRLGGNSLLECTVFGTIVGQKIPVKTMTSVGQTSTNTGKVTNSKEPTTLPTISLEELAKHNTKEDIWVAIHGVVYDFTEFAHEHPAGFDSIFDLAGKDGTEAFSAIHNQAMLEDFEEDRKGLLKV